METYLNTQELFLDETTRSVEEIRPTYSNLTVYKRSLRTGKGKSPYRCLWGV